MTAGSPRKGGREELGGLGFHITYQAQVHNHPKGEYRMKKVLSVIFVFLIAVSLVACSGGKAPAEKAITAAEEALNAGKTEAVKYIPDEVKAAEDALQAAKDSFAKGDYTGATSAATALMAKAKDLGTAAAAKKAELTNAWGEISVSLPKMIEEVKGRIDSLAKSKKLPANLDKEKFEAVKSGFAEITQMWDEAANTFKEGSLADAMTKAKAVKEKVGEAMTTLGMQTAEAPKS